MSLECSECEWDARSGHHPDCSRSPESKNKQLKERITALERENQRLRFAVIAGQNDPEAVRKLLEAARRMTTQWASENSRELADALKPFLPQEHDPMPAPQEGKG